MSIVAEGLKMAKVLSSSDRPQGETPRRQAVRCPPRHQGGLGLLPERATIRPGSNPAASRRRWSASPCRSPDCHRLSADVWSPARFIARPRTWRPAGEDIFRRPPTSTRPSEVARAGCRCSLIGRRRPSRPPWADSPPCFCGPSASAGGWRWPSFAAVSAVAALRRTECFDLPVETSGAAVSRISRLSRDASGARLWQGWG